MPKSTGHSSNNPPSESSLLTMAWDPHQDLGARVNEAFFTMQQSQRDLSGAIEHAQQLPLEQPGGDPGACLPEWVQEAQRDLRQIKSDIERQQRELQVRIQRRVALVVPGLDELVLSSHLRRVTRELDTIGEKYIIEKSLAKGGKASPEWEAVLRETIRRTIARAADEVQEWNLRWDPLEWERELPTAADRTRSPVEIDSQFEPELREVTAEPVQAVVHEDLEELEELEALDVPANDAQKPLALPVDEYYTDQEMSDGDDVEVDDLSDGGERSEPEAFEAVEIASAVFMNGLEYESYLEDETRGNGDAWQGEADIVDIGDEPADEPGDEPADEPSDEPADEPSDEPADEPGQELEFEYESENEHEHEHGLVPVHRLEDELEHEHQHEREDRKELEHEELFEPLEPQKPLEPQFEDLLDEPEIDHELLDAQFEELQKAVETQEPEVPASDDLHALVQPAEHSDVEMIEAKQPETPVGTEQPEPEVDQAASPAQRALPASFGFDITADFDHSPDQVAHSPAAMPEESQALDERVAETPSIEDEPAKEPVREVSFHPFDVSFNIVPEFETPFQEVQRPQQLNVNESLADEAATIVRSAAKMFGRSPLFGGRAPPKEVVHSTPVQAKTQDPKVISSSAKRLFNNSALFGGVARPRAPNFLGEISTTASFKRDKDFEMRYLHPIVKEDGAVSDQSKAEVASEPKKIVEATNAAAKATKAVSTPKADTPKIKLQPKPKEYKQPAKETKSVKNQTAKAQPAKETKQPAEAQQKKAKHVPKELLKETKQPAKPKQLKESKEPTKPALKPAKAFTRSPSKPVDKHANHTANHTAKSKRQAKKEPEERTRRKRMSEDPETPQPKKMRPEEDEDSVRRSSRLRKKS